MSLLFNKDKTELIITCDCGCDNGAHLRINKDSDDFYCVMYLISSKFYSEQDKTVWRIIKEKFKKIWAIIRNKDFYLMDIVVSKEDWDTFKEYVNSVGEEQA